MTPRRAGRTQICGRPQAATRLAHAHKFLDAAELVATDIEDFLPNMRAAPRLASEIVTRLMVGCIRSVIGGRLAGGLG